MPGTEEFPVFYTEEEQANLMGSPFVAWLKQELLDQKTDYETLVREIPGFGKNFTQENFTHASYLVISRNFGVMKNGRDIHMMVPMADMFNTEWEFNSHWYYSDEKQGFCVEALRDIVKDEQLLDTYGHKSNAEYLMNYAFILLDKDQNNDRDEYPLIVHMDPQDP